MNRGAAAAERVEHHVAGVRGGVEDALQQGDGLLGGVAEASIFIEQRRLAPRSLNGGIVTKDRANSVMIQRISQLVTIEL
jgi:hypothetical protein